MASKTLNPTQSVYVNYNYKDNNYNGESCLRVGVGSSSSKRTQTLLQFPLEDVAGGVTKATLRLYSYSDECWNASVTQLVQRNTSAWDPATVTYNSKPATVTEGQASATVSGYDKWYEWDVTEIVKAQKAGENFGVTVLQDGTATSKAKCFKRTGNNAPQLVVEFNPMTYNGGNEVAALTYQAQPVNALSVNGVEIY